ncbi:Basic helix-loop-helix DNA-binding superfamily protein putative isoform 3 [Tripterygium wilfordii]|uniref:Basic helix-loop-helix DNA-binding superfamily protein putative isoform 3 n=1 Tax=Tripterygium wilfordii TaxID=458696 RepID=A0A7J7CEH7_TRIWF|nr:Basic helix-loop-helix DNA-binding superfamily protein putative isoform 3 [Tripterygium wilfordii]
MEMVMSRPSSSSSSTKIERKVIEKNRRLHMKTLFSDLNSLLPSTATSKEALSLPDQIGEYGFEAAILTERLCAFINGFSSEVELEPEELWGFEFHPEMWEILN